MELPWTVRVLASLFDGSWGLPVAARSSNALGLRRTLVQRSRGAQEEDLNREGDEHVVSPPPWRSWTGT